jgi:hypothetical protein
MTLQALPHSLFDLVMVVVAIGWLALLFFPRKHWANFWVAGVIIPGILGVVYTALMITYWFQHPRPAPAFFFSLTGAYQMFANSGMLLAAWTDIVLLSLVAGAWVTRKAVQLGMPRWLLLLLLLIMFGFPGTGLVIFFGIAAWMGGHGRLSNLENATAPKTAPAPSR